MGGGKYVEKKNHTRREIHSALSLYYVSTNAWATQINITLHTTDTMLVYYHIILQLQLAAEWSSDSSLGKVV